MKIIAMSVLCMLVVIPMMAQQNAGKIVYNRTVQVRIQVFGNNEGMENMLPKTRTDKFELTFANNQSLWKQAEQEDDGDMTFNNNGSTMMVRTIGAGSEDIMYTNLEQAKRVELRELATKKYIVEDSVRRMDWKLSDETKTILGHLCRKATSQRIGTRTMMTMENGQMDKKTITDTSNIVAWFTSDIPVSIGPGEYQGQLPGAILEVDINNGRTLFTAQEITDKVNVATIKEPKGNKKLTPAEFTKERDKMLEEMSRNNAGPGRTFRVN